MMYDFQQANDLLKAFKKGRYLHGLDVLDQIGITVTGLGNKAMLVSDQFPDSDHFVQIIKKSLKASGVVLMGEARGAAPNCPREDLFRITDELRKFEPDFVISFGGGSTIDATKAAVVLHILSGDIDSYFGTGLVSKALEETKKKLIPHVAVQTASSSAAHLTKYANITDLSTGQKKLIVDTAIVPDWPVFDYSVTFHAPHSLTADGAMDGISHALEVLFSAVGKPEYPTVEKAAVESIRLAVQYLPRVIENPEDPEARFALGLATDLGGYCIMLGGTNGAHLTSFSLVDILSHGRACGLLNPYFTVFFAPAIQQPLLAVGKVFLDAGYIEEDLNSFEGRELGEVVARAMLSFQNKMGFPTQLSQIAGFSNLHINRILTAAKDPQLKMKLENMPVAVCAETVDLYWRKILDAAVNGDLSLIENAP